MTYQPHQSEDTTLKPVAAHTRSKDMDGLIALARECGTITVPRNELSNDHDTALFTTPEQLDLFAQRIREECAKAVEALRDDHCRATRMSDDTRDWCRPEGGDGCEFVEAWNDAAAAIRANNLS